MFKHFNLMSSTSPKPFGFVTVPGDGCSSIFKVLNLQIGWNVHDDSEATPLHLWTTTRLAVTWILLDLLDDCKPVSISARLDDGCRMMKTSFYGYWYWTLGAGLISVMSAAGSRSLVGWCDTLSCKLKIT